MIVVRLILRHHKYLVSTSRYDNDGLLSIWPPLMTLMRWPDCLLARNSYLPATFCTHYKRFPLDFGFSFLYPTLVGRYGRKSIFPS